MSGTTKSDDANQSILTSERLYQYEPFTDENSIRTLILLPAPSPSSDIYVILSIVKFTDNPIYDALSYTWATKDGDSSKSGFITCEGAKIRVTKNCENALRKLRDIDREETLWIDAICIDQQNDEERGQQISLMGSIYGRAYTVVVWLGDDSEAVDQETGTPISTLFLDYLVPMAKELHESRSEGEGLMHSPLYNDMVLQTSDFVSSGRRTPLVDGFLDVILRPWWERVWVVQEAALADDAVVICGERTVNYLDFYVLFLQIFVDSTHESGLTLSLLEGYKHHMMSVLHVREEIHDVGYVKALRVVLSRSRRLRATDKRDHIFALLDIFGDFKSELTVPNYSKSAVEVFTDTTMRLLPLMGSLDVLLQATNVEDGSKVPSWVTDWSQRPQFHIPQRDGLYHASGKSKLHYEILDGGKGLKLLGTSVGVLEKLPKADILAYKNPYVPTNGILGYQQSCRVALSMSRYPTGEDLTEVLWRTLCWNVDENDCYPADPELGMPFEHFLRALTSGHDVDDIEKQLHDEAVRFNDICVHSMPLGIMSNGYLASVPWTAEEGDQIMIFSGGELPFVLRRHSTTGHFRLIGACYVHGMMDGEAFPANLDDLKSISIY